MYRFTHWTKYRTVAKNLCIHQWLLNEHGRNPPKIQPCITSDRKPQTNSQQMKVVLTLSKNIKYAMKGGENASLNFWTNQFRKSISLYSCSLVDKSLYRKHKQL